MVGIGRQQGIFVLSWIPFAHVLSQIEGLLDTEALKEGCIEEPNELDGIGGRSVCVGTSSSGGSDHVRNSCLDKGLRNLDCVSDEFV